HLPAPEDPGRRDPPARHRRARHRTGRRDRGEAARHGARDPAPGASQPRRDARRRGPLGTGCNEMTARDAHSDDMERLLRYLGATAPLEIDFGPADRLLDGGVHADDAPRAYSQVARALETLRSMPTEAELANERQAVARIAGVIAAETVRYNGERA